MADSTSLVAGKTKQFAAEIYKTFLHCAAKVVRAEGGTITAYDGDRIMAVYMGKGKNTSAVRTALKIHSAVLHIVTPAIRANYAAKLTTLPHECPTWITEEVYNNMHESVKLTNGRAMWEARSWTAMNDKRIYRSN